MYQIQVQTLRSLLLNNQISQQSLEGIIADLENGLNIQKIYDYVAEIAKNLANTVQPFVRLNSIIVAHRLLNLANYPYLLFAQIYLMPHIQKITDFLISNPGLQQQTQFFQQQGYSANIPYLQNLSYKFVTTTSNFLQLAAKIKPFRVYQGRQYSQSSIFKQKSQKLLKNYDHSQFPMKLQKSKDSQTLRQKYLYNLSNWNEYQGNLLQFFIKVIEQYLCSGVELQKHELSFNQILRYGQPLITSEIIARLIEIVSSSYNFKIRTRALKIIDNLILWGDVQALLVVNFTEHIQIVVKNILYAKGDVSIDEGSKIYPQIGGQEEQKLEFYTFLLRCIQVWGQCYPKNDYFNYQNKRKNDESVMFRLYKLLRDNKKFKFPQNLMLTRYEKQSHLNMKEKMIRNQIILIDINGQKQSILMEQSKTFQEVQKFYQAHKECLLLVISNGTKDLSQNINKLLNFKELFQYYVESIQSISNENQDIDLLIENGLELIDLIQAIYQPYVLYLKQQSTAKQFKDTVANLCFNYFNEDQKKQNEGSFRRFLSEKLRVKRRQLQFLKVRSIPQENELKMIVNDLNIKQLRAKIKKKRQKTQDTRSSQSSVLSLEIYTRNKFSKSSGDSNQHQKKDNSMNSDQNSLKKIISNNHNKIEPLNNNQSPQSQAKSNSKKRITVVSKNSKHLSDNDKNVAENGSPLKSSKLSQISTDATNNKGQNKVQNMLIVKIPLDQNAQYYEYLRNQQFKYSYTLAHIIIFKSEQLVVERVLCQIIQGEKIKIKIYIILIPSVDLSNVCYTVQDQGCIQISDNTKPFPHTLQSQARYTIELVGQMKKIPLKLPTVRILVEKTPVLEYILPFTINFFLDCHSNQPQVLENYRAMQGSLHSQFISETFACSPVLFPQGNIDSIFIYFPFVIKLEKLGEKKEIFLWQVKHNELSFLIVIEFYKNQGEMKVKLQTSKAWGQTFGTFFKYVLNYMVHLLGDFSHRKA